MTRPTSDDHSPPSAHEAPIRALLLQGQHGGVASFNGADIARTVIALRLATPSSIRDEVALLPIIYGTGWSYGKIQATLVEAE